jgi:nitrogen fixation-related uncharacterized protein
MELIIFLIAVADRVIGLFNSLFILIAVSAKEFGVILLYLIYSVKKRPN